MLEPRGFKKKPSMIPKYRHQRDDQVQPRNGWTSTMEQQLTNKLNRLDTVNAKQAKLVTFFKNGDPHFKGLKTSVSKKEFHTFDTLLEWLTLKIPMAGGVKHIFLIPGKAEAYYLEVKDVTQFVGGRQYLVSNSKIIAPQPKGIKYGKSLEQYWKNRPPTGGKFRKGEFEKLLDTGHVWKARSFPSSRTGSLKGYKMNHHPEHSKSETSISPIEMSLDSGHGRPRVLTVVSNTHRDSSQKLMLNPKTTQSYEDVLADINDMLVSQYPPVTSLWTMLKPHVKVKGFSHLLQTLKSHSSFLAVGQEDKPFVKTKHQESEVEDEQLPQNGRKHKTHRYRNAELEGYQKVGAAYDYDSVSDQESLQITHTPRSPPQATRHQPRKAQARYLSDRESPPGAEQFVEEHRKQPYFRPHEERESVTVHIHGFPRKFYAPRYGQHEPDGSKPKKKLRLDWVYGYRGRDSRNNLFVLPTDELVYFVSAVAVVYDTRHNQQRHYTEHTEDITCIAIHPDKTKPKVATGQLAGDSPDDQAHVRVWDPVTMVTYAVVGYGSFNTAVNSVGFSIQTGTMETGALLMAIDEGERHMMSVWNWQIDRLVAKTTTSTDTVVWGQIHPHDHTILVTFGKNHVFFWKLFWDPDSQSEGKILRDKKSGQFENQNMPKFVTSLTFSRNGDVITGDSNGRIIVWQSDLEEAFVYNPTLSASLTNAHQKSVFVLCMLDDGTLVSGGGRSIKCWDSLNGYQLINETEVLPECGFVRTLAPTEKNDSYNELYVGTTENCILQGTMRDHFKTIVQGHCGSGSCYNEDNFNTPRSKAIEFVWKLDKKGPYDECWSVATHPDDYTFVTAGVDQKVRKWDSLNRAVVWETRVEKPCLSLDLDPTGALITLGTSEGRFIVLSNLDGMHIFSMQVGKAQLGVIKFSPEGNFIAVGSHDSFMYVYKVEKEGQVFRRHRSCVLRGHKNFVTHIDWSRNSRFLRSMSGNYDLKFWSVEEMREVSGGSLREEIWSTENCVLSFSHLGAWSNLSSGRDINCSDLAHKKDILAVGENMGTIKLYRFPCTAERPHYIEQKKYSGHVTKVAFTFDDNFLITCGGRDAGILQWAVVKTGPL